MDFPVLSSLNEGVIGPSSGGNDSNTNINLQLSLIRNKYSRLILVTYCSSLTEKCRLYIANNFPGSENASQVKLFK